MMEGEQDLESVVVDPEKGTVVEGVGDEVLVVGGTSLALLLALSALFITGRRSAAANIIHPEQADPVENARREMGVDGERREGDEGAELGHCPICLAELTHRVDTNCGHVFCAECILTYWQHDQWPQAAKCAVCRRPVTLLLPSPSLYSPAAQHLWRQVSDYNQRMSGQPRPLLHYLYDVPTLLRHFLRDLWRDLFTVRGLVTLHRLHIMFILVILILYFLSPLDIIPEAVFGLFGLLDDLIFVVLALVYASLIYRAHVANAGLH